MMQTSKIQYRLRQAREDLGWTRMQMAENMDMSLVTISQWENGKRALTLEKLLRMSDVTGFTVQYLLGFDDIRTDWTTPLSKETLVVMHRMPVWTVSNGWALVNTATWQLVFADQSAIKIDVLQEAIYGFPPVLAYSLYGAGEPLRLHEVEQSSRVWVELISTDIKLSSELRGWYHLHGKRLVQNEFGNRFYLDTYGAKWLAFKDCFGDSEDKSP